jgi:hypothetical protein
MEKEKPLTLTQAQRMLKAKQKTWLQKDKVEGPSYLTCATGIIPLTDKVAAKLWDELPYYGHEASVLQTMDEKGTEMTTVRTRITRCFASYNPLFKGG